MNTDKMIQKALEQGLIKVTASTGEVYGVRVSKLLGCFNLKGYKVATLHLDGQRTQIKLHRVIWIARYGLIPKGLVIDHINGKKADNRIENLRLADAKLNSQNRRSYKGENNPSAKITYKIAQKIRVSYQTFKSYRKLAKIFKISPTLVAKIIRNEIWTLQ